MLPIASCEQKQPDSKTDLMSFLQLKEAEGEILTRNLKGKIGKCKKRAGPASRGTGGA